MLFLSFVLLGPVDTTKTYCQSGFKLTRMFKLMNRVYFGDQTKLFHYDLTTGKHHQSSQAKDFGNTIRKVEMAVHFDLVLACSPNASNAGFCEHSKVYDSVAVLVGGGEMRMHRVNGDKLEQYTSATKEKKPKQEVRMTTLTTLTRILITNFSNSNVRVKQGSQAFLPSENVRLAAIVKQVFT